MDELLRELKDRADITELKARYFRAVDTQNWELLESLFIEDAVFTGNRVGTAGFVARSRSTLEGGWSVHHGYLPELRIDGDTATGIWAMDDYLGLPSGALRRGFGHYEETYVRTPDGWRIASITLTRLREELLSDTGANGWTAVEPMI